MAFTAEIRGGSAYATAESEYRKRNVDYSMKLQRLMITHRGSSEKNNMETEELAVRISRRIQYGVKIMC